MKAGAILYLVSGLLGGATVGWFAKDLSRNNNQTTETFSTKSHRGQSTITDSTESNSNKSHNSKSGNLSGFSELRAHSTLSNQQLNDLGSKLKETTDPLERGFIFNQLLAGMTSENAQMLREHIKGLPSNDPEFRKFHFMYGKLAGEKAILFGLDSPEGDGGAIMEGWASIDPQSAKEWFENLNVEDLPQFEKLKERGLTQERLKPLLQNDLVMGMFQNNPTDAALYLDSLAGKGQEARLAEQLSENIVRDLITRQGPDAAVEWVANFSDDKIASTAISELADEWSETAPTEALEWAKSISGDSRQQALYEVMRNMGGKVGGADPFAAADEINLMEASADKDHALSGYSRGVSRHYPQVALEAALEIGDNNLREQSVIRAGSYYLRRMPEKASEFLTQSGLPDATIQRIRRGAGLRN